MKSPASELERRLQDCTAQLEAARSELNMLSYAVSHDLRAPLRAVEGFTQALLEDYAAQLPEEGQFLVKTIRESAQQMGSLFDDLQRYSRLGRNPLQLQNVELGHLVQEELENLRAGLLERVIEFRIADLPNCTGDPGLLKQVWAQLLANAVKFTAKSERAVVEVGVRDEAGKTVYFVRDNGAGFDMKYAGRLFGLFQRLHRDEVFAGRGVGLAMVRRIIHLHGGSVWATAELDRGATFFFTLGENVSSQEPLLKSRL